MADTALDNNEWEDVAPEQAAAPPASSAAPAATDDWQDVPQDQWGGYASVAARATARGAITGAGEAIKGAAEVAAPQPGAEAFNRRALAVIDRIDRGERVTPAEDPIGYQDMDPTTRKSTRADMERAVAAQQAAPYNPQESPVYKAGEAVSKFGEEHVPLTPQEQQSITGRAFSGVGGMLPAMAAGAALGPEVGIPAAAAVFGVQGAAEQAAAARAKGATPENVQRAADAGFLLNAAGGLLPFHSVLRPIERSAPGLMDWAATRLKLAAQSGVTFASVGEAQEWLGQQIAQKYYDPSAGYSFDIRRVLGNLLSGGVLAQLRLTPYRAGEAAAQPAQGTETQPAAGAGPPGPPGAAGPAAALTEILRESAPPGRQIAPESTSILPEPAEEHHPGVPGGLTEPSMAAPQSSPTGPSDFLRQKGLTYEQLAAADTKYLDVLEDEWAATHPDEPLLHVETFKPSEIKADPARFQFRTDQIDPSGITASKKLRPGGFNQTFPLVVWRDLNNNDFIVDGHHRLHAAKEMEAAGQPIDLHAIVLNEADGVTPQMAKDFGERRNDYRDATAGARRMPGLNATPQEIAQLQDAIGRKADPEEIEKLPIVQRAYELGNEQRPTNEQPGYGTPEYRANRVFNFNGEQVVGWDNAVDRLEQRAHSFSPDGPVAKDRRAFIVTGPGGAGKSSAVMESLARRTRSAVVDADEAKPTMAEYAGGKGASAVHEESTDLTYGPHGVLQRILGDGSNFVIGKIGHKLDSIRALRDTLKARGYKVSLINVDIDAKEAFRRRMGRFLRSGRINSTGFRGDSSSAVGGIVTKNYHILKGEGFDGAITIDNNVRGRPYEGSEDLAREIGLQHPGSAGRARYRKDVGDYTQHAAASPAAELSPALSPHRVTAADGTAINVRPVVVDADNVLTSQDAGYDPELQPRQRDRAASQAQVRDIASNLDPERLGYSAEADRGAPIVGPDGMVESGNGRILALRNVYERDGARAQAYRDWLTRQGVDVSQFKNPVLVRERTTELTPDQRRNFTVSANQAATLAMSAPERALVDAGHIDAGLLSLIHNADDLASPANRQFFRRFVASLPQAEQGTMADAKGNLSADGVARVRNAILAKAYGDAATLSRIAESTNDEIKSVSNALVAAAPQWARFRAAVEAGHVRPDMDATPELIEAVNRTADIRGRGDKLDEYLGQRDAFDQLKPPVEGFMRMFYDPKGRKAAASQRITDALRFYADEAGKVSAQPGLDLKLTPVDPIDVQRLAREKEWEDAGPEVSDRYGTGDVAGGEAVGREARGPRAGAGGELPSQRGPGGFEESAIRAQQPTPDELRGSPLDPYKPLATFPGEDGMEARIYPNRDGKRFNVMLYDRDSGETLNAGFIVPSFEAAKQKARSLVEPPREQAQRPYPPANDREIKRLDKKLRDLYRGYDIAYDMAMNDGGASVRRLQAEIATVQAERDKLARPVEVPEPKEPKPTLEDLRQSAKIPEGFEVERGEPVPEGDYHRNLGYKFSVVVRRAKPWAVERGYGETMADAQDRALRKLGAFPPITETVPLAGGKTGQQFVLPGAEKISTAELLRRRAAEPMRPTVAQEIPGGLFGDLLGQEDLFRDGKQIAGQEVSREGQRATRETAAELAQPAARGAEPPALGGQPEGGARPATPEAGGAPGRGEAAGLTPPEAVPISATTETPGGTGTRPARGEVRAGAQAVPGGAQPRRPAPAKRPAQLSLFGGEPSGEHGAPPSIAVPAQQGGAKSTAPAPSPSVTKPPTRGGGTGAARPDISAPPVRAGIREAEQKIAERSRSNYRITPEDRIGEGGPKEKVRQNLDAIRLLKRIEDEDREATPGEKAVLVKYVGWGAFAQDMFKPGKRTGWEEEREALRALLTDEEYERARASTLNAHYTSPDVIRGMWGALSHLGYEGGSALEPAAGIGHFIGLIPDDVASRTAWTAVELDPLSARITEALYGGADVNAIGFEKLKRPSNYYDLAISNVPFGDYPISEKPYGKFPQIHDFFFVKSLDKVRPGGVVAFITSAGTMDKARPDIRNLLSKTADLVGAIRLPGGRKGAFAGNAGTEVTTDIVFLRKKIPGETGFPGAKWADLKEVQTPEGPTKINEYFADNPKMMLGEMRLTGSMYGENEPVLIGDAAGLQERIAEAARSMPAGALAPRLTPKPPTIDPTEIRDNVKDGSFFAQDGKIYQRVLGVGQERKFSAEQADKVTRLAGLRDLYNDLLDAQLKGAGDPEALREKMRKAYDAFVDKYGPINKEVRTTTSRLNKAGDPVVIVRHPNFDLFDSDPDAFKVSSIENYDPEKGTAKRADIQTRDIIRPPVTREINGPSDALSASLNDTGGVDLDHIANSLGVDSTDEAAGLLGDLIFNDPNGRQWATADEYLSGNVVQKLEEARALAQTDTSYLRNVTALEKVQPTPKPPGPTIAVQLGAPWVPPDIVESFMSEVMGAQNARVKYVPETNRWLASAAGFSRDGQAKWGVGSHVDPLDTINDALNNGLPTVYGDRDSNGKRPVLEAPTEEARQKLNSLKEAFTGDPDYGLDGWWWQDHDRGNRMAAIFNRTYNNIANRKFDGSHLTFPGLDPMFTERQHRKDAVWRMIKSGNTLLAHDVGTGKTVTMIAGGMEMKRLGLIQKPMFTVPNHMLEQFSREFLQAYPNAKVLVASKDEMSRDNRKAFIAKAASNDWDGIVITHDAFGRINVDREFRRQYMQEQLDELERVRLAESEESGAKSKTVKELEKAKKKLEERLRALMNEERKDEGLNFEHTGVDFLFVDEAHLFKNLSFISRMRNIQGLRQGDAQRAEDLFLKIRYLEQNRPGRSAALATGTPVSNTMAEMWTMMRYLELNQLKERGLDHFDAWANTFGKTKTNMELSVDGRTLVPQTSFSKFSNINQLMQLYSEVADTVTAEQTGIKRPDVKTRSGNPGIEIVEAQPSDQEEKYLQALVKLAEEIKGQRPEPGTPNMASIGTAGRKIALDGRLVGNTMTDKAIIKKMGKDFEGFDFNPNGKVAKAVTNISRIYQEGNKDPAAPNKAQMVFLDMGAPRTGAREFRRIKMAGSNETWLGLPEDSGTTLLTPDETPDGLYHVVQEDTGKVVGKGETQPKAVRAADKAGAFPPEDRIDIYNDLKKRLVEAGIPAKEIAFIHDAPTDEKKADLFEKVRTGRVRVIVGSSQKMGVGTNVQRLLIAMHHLDSPYRPADVTQRDGRIVRQGNLNNEVQIYRYVTAKSFDAFMWQKLERKARFLGQIASGAKGLDVAEHVDNPLPEAAEMKAAASGDPRIAEHAELDRQVRQLASQRRVFDTTKQRASYETDAAKQRIKMREDALPDALDDAAMVNDLAGDKFQVDLGDKGILSDRKQAGKAILDGLLKLDPRAFIRPASVKIGTLSGFDMNMLLQGGWDGDGYNITATPSLKGRAGYGAANTTSINSQTDPLGLMGRFERVLRNIKTRPEELQEGIKQERDGLERLEKTLNEEWPKEKEYRAAVNKLKALSEALKAPKPAAAVEAEAAKEEARRPTPATVTGSPQEGERAVKIGPTTTAYLADKYTAAEQKIADAVNAIVKRMAPQAEVIGARAIRQRGAPVWGMNVHDPAFPSLIAWSLERAGPVEGKATTLDLTAHTARHEIIHNLRHSGMIRPEEWSALERAARDEDWAGKYDIEERYPDLSPEAKLEEAIAEHFAGWRTDRSVIREIKDPVQRFVRDAYNRLDLFFRRIAAAARQFLGKDATANDVFSRIESGEVGGRSEGEIAPAEAAAKGRSYKVRFPDGEVGQGNTSVPYTHALIGKRTAGPEPSNKFGVLALSRSPDQLRKQIGKWNWHTEKQIVPLEYGEQAQTPEREARERRQAMVAAAGGPHSVWGHIVNAGDRLREAADTFAKNIGLDEFAHGLQMKWTPMAAHNATVESRAIVKRYLNARRAARERWNKADRYIEENFQPEQRQKMWDAGDEQSVAMQQNRPTQGIGLDRLTPHERQVTEMLQGLAEDKFKEARDLGMIEGEGLPSYMPRMVVRMSETGKYEKGIGPTAEVVRDIRTLALAIAKLEDAIAARRLIQSIKEIGDKTGNPTVNVGGEPTYRPGAEAMVSHAIDVSMGKGFSTTTPNLKHRKYLTREETEAAARRAPAPDTEGPKWQTLANPAFQVWRPKMVSDPDEGVTDTYRGEVKRISDMTVPQRMVPAKDQNGEIVWEKVPLYVREDFEGPLRAALEQDWGAKAQQKLMSFKGKVMSVIMFSPLIHNQVEWGRAIPAAPGKVLTFQTYLEGNRVANDPAKMREAIDGGLVPIGGHGFMQDIAAIAEAPNLQPGHSLTAAGLGYGTQALGHLTHIYDPKATADQVRRSVDWFGNFWHNTMLWDRIRDLQLGLWSHVKEAMLGKGHDPYSANVVAAHFANRYAGSLPIEAMSGLARGIANLLLFSRSFTIGNIGAYKDAVMGLPRDAQALIQDKLGWNELQKAQSFVRKKSQAMLMIDAGLYYATLSALQSAFHVAGPAPTMMTLGGMIAGGALGGRYGPYGRLVTAAALGAGGWGAATMLGFPSGSRTAAEEADAYWERFKNLALHSYQHPFGVALNPFAAVTGLLSTAENEPGMHGRILVGYDKDGTALYMRLPAGKVTEELLSWVTEPLDLLHRKLSTFAKPIDEIFENNMGFGRKAYDPHADTPVSLGHNLMKAAWLIIKAQLPFDPAASAVEATRGGTDAGLEGLKATGQATGFTFRKGFPGGPAAGEIHRAKEDYEYRKQEAMPDIRDKIRHGDIAGAQKLMASIGMPQKERRFVEWSTQNPGRRPSKTQMREFMQYATPEQIQRWEEAERRGGRAEGGSVDIDGGGEPIPKEGQTVAPPDVLGDQESLRRKVVDAAGSALGINDAMRAARGEMSDDEAKEFALGAAASLGAGSIASKLARPAAIAIRVFGKGAQKELKNRADGGATDDDGPVSQDSDYDMAAARAAGVQPDERGHFPDTYKLPTHITFSDESIYHNPANQGGHWEQVNGDEWNFTPGPANLQHHSVEELQDYFQKYEPKSHLILPAQRADGGAVSSGKRVRSAFGYMEGRPGDKQFAQCKTCVTWLRKIERCYYLPKDFKVDADDTCIMYAEGKPCDDPKVRPLGNLTPKEVGFYDGQVRCPNCNASDFKGDAATGKCQLYEHLNKSFPDKFDLDPNIKRVACCNAFEPKTKRAAGGRVVASNINHRPSEAQKVAGNYAKDHLHFQGLPLTIENAKGSFRSGVGPDGKPWRCQLPCHYGYIKRTEGADGDHVDVFLGPHIKAPKVFVIDQVKAESGKFDEHKAMLGFGSIGQALQTYKRAFSDGKGHDRIGHVTTMTLDEFRNWLKTDTSKPIGKYGNLTTH